MVSLKNRLDVLLLCLTIFLLVFALHTHSSIQKKLNETVINKLIVDEHLKKIKLCHLEQFQNFENKNARIIDHSQACLPNFYLSFPFSKELLGKTKL